jgi:hypothetical protein
MRIGFPEHIPKWRNYLLPSEAATGWTHRHFICLPRHTGEVARRAGGGKPQSRYRQISDLKFSEITCFTFPLRPLRGHLPRKTGEI